MKTSRGLFFLALLSCTALTFAACSDEKKQGTPGTGGFGGQGGAAPGSGGESVGGQGGSAPVLEEVTLSFRPQVGDELFACGQSYQGQGSSDVEVTPQDFRFFASSISLVNEAGVEVPLILDEADPWQSSEVALLDFEDGTGSCKNGNGATNVEIKAKIPEGKYTGLVFSTAVPVDLNHEDPTTLPAPLQAGGMSWNWLLGFKFIRAELVETQGGETPGAGIFHLGSTGCSNVDPGEGGAGGQAPNPMAAPSIACANQNRNKIVLDEFDASSDVIIADIGALMADNDLSAVAACHSKGELCEDYFENAGLDFASGEAQAEQSVFRVGQK